MNEDNYVNQNISTLYQFKKCKKNPTYFLFYWLFGGFRNQWLCTLCFEPPHRYIFLNSFSNQAQ